MRSFTVRNNTKFKILVISYFLFFACTIGFIICLFTGNECSGENIVTTEPQGIVKILATGQKIVLDNLAHYEVKDTIQVSYSTYNDKWELEKYFSVVVDPEVTMSNGSYLAVIEK